MPLNGDKQRFHWSVSDGAADWSDYPGHHQGLRSGRIAVLECTHGHSATYQAAASSGTKLTHELRDSIGCVVHGSSASFEESIRKSGLMRMARRGQDARTSIHFSAYRQQSGAQAYHDYGLHVYLRTKQLVMAGREVTVNTHGVVLCNYDIPFEYLVVSDIHPRNLVGEQTVLLHQQQLQLQQNRLFSITTKHRKAHQRRFTQKKADVLTQPPVPIGTVPADDPTGDEPKLTEEDIRSAFQEASQEVAQEKEEESKKRQKEQKRAEQDENRIIQAYLQEAEQARGPLSTFSYESSEDSFNEPVPIYHPLAAPPYRVRERLKGLGYVNEDTWCYNLSSGFARTFEYATLYVGRARFLMDLIDGLERTCDADAVRDKILLLKEHLRDFFPRFVEWEKLAKDPRRRCV
eukprot:650935-Amphidinium_carterae.1